MSDRERVEREAGLRAAVLAGDETSWRVWYDASDSAVRRYLNWRCAGQVDLVEEVAQDAWLTAVRKIRTFDPNAGCFVAWVCGLAALILRNHLRKHHRQAARRRALVEVQAPSGESNNGDQSWFIAEALADLPPRHEQVLRAKYLDGQSVAEIAAQWHESPKAVESVLARARESFRTIFDERVKAEDERR